MSYRRTVSIAGLLICASALAACGGGPNASSVTPAAQTLPDGGVRAAQNLSSPSFTATYAGPSSNGIVLYPTPCGHVPATYVAGGATITGGPLTAGQTVTVYGTLLDAKGNSMSSGCPDRVTGVTDVVVGTGAPPALPPPTAPPASGGRVPHIPTVIGDRTSGSVSPATVAAAVDYVFGGTSASSDRWRASGVKTIAYADPIVQYGPPDYAPWLNSDESTYLRACNGGRSTVSYQSFTGWFMDPASPAYQRIVGKTITADAPHFDAFMIDDALSNAIDYGWSVVPPCDTWVGFNYSNPATVANAKLASMLGTAFAGTSTYLNGLGLAPGDGNPWWAMQGALTDPTVAGGTYEFCFLGDTDHRLQNKRIDSGWQSIMASYVDTVKRGRTFWCIALTGADGNSDVGRDQRLYTYASFLLAFDGHAMLQETFGESNGLPVYPETRLVPSDPLDAPGSNPRRFGSCAIAGAPIGACASFVNPSASRSASVPGGYGAVLRLVGGSVFEGGSLASDAVPATIGPAEGVVLVQGGALPAASARAVQSVRTGAPIFVPLPGRMGTPRTKP
jgi:hypothetical protein